MGAGKRRSRENVQCSGLYTYYTGNDRVVVRTKAGIKIKNIGEQHVEERIRGDRVEKGRISRLGTQHV